MNWKEYVLEHGIPEWPYPIRYGKETESAATCLVLGGGIAGCWAAISAARMGAKVVLVEKGATIKSGSGGSGCDHWLNTPHPGSPVTAEEVVEWELGMRGGYTNALSRYVAARESFETLLELEKMGGKIRDMKDEFKGAPFRDEKSKFLFAYDYVGPGSISASGGAPLRFPFTKSVRSSGFIFMIGSWQQDFSLRGARRAGGSSVPHGSTAAMG